MSRRPCRATEADLKRAARAAKALGEGVAVKIDADGSIWLVPAKDAPAPPVGAQKTVDDDGWSLVK